MKKHIGRSGAKDKKKAAAAAKEPQTWEEYMEGERYATGEKARRYYEKAGDMYHKAHRLNPQDADIIYNLGRILYILVDFTFSPCQKLSLLNASILRFRKALNYDPDNADSLFNLGQAMATHADLIQDHTEDEEHDHDHGESAENSTGVDNPEEQAAIELQEAVALFERCFVLQQRDLFEAVQLAHPTEEADKVEKPEGLAEQEQRELSAQAGVLIDTLISTSQALTSLAFSVEDPLRAKDYYKQGIDKLEIALGVAGDRLLWPQEDEDEKKKGKGRDLDAASSTLSLLGDDEMDGEIAPAVRPVSVFREAEPSSETVKKAEKLCDIHLQYSNLLSSQSDRSFQDTGKINEDLYEASLRHLDIVLGQQPRHVEALCDKGDMLGSWAQGLVAYVIDTGADSENGADSEVTAWDSASNVALAEAPKREVASARSQASLSKRIWQLFALATRSFLSALEVEPQNTSILEKLGDIHWTRSRLGSAVAVKNRAQLLNNANVYYRYAWESCRETGAGGGAAGAGGASNGGQDSVDEEQRLEILLSWAQVLRAMPGRQEDVLRVLKQWKRYGGTKQMLKDLIEGHASDILQEDFLEFALDLVRKGL
ncbi:hypothetical protein DFQ27_007465 [Actinomortierella ambigua]|uniref:TPR-like protein n=1 Tax=Actinomortierella ambigua TaxID=1343610 RepID=A0A9P6QL51_9FUNG|nr:hypothetical protein DFQ27_007465 [Actinomortierella ambigua]